MTRLICIFFFIAGVLAIGADVFGQTTVTLISNNDAYVDFSFPSTNFNNTELNVGYIPPEFSTTYRTFIGFNLLSIPSNALINSASLRVNLQSFSGTSTLTIEARQVLATWFGSTITWDNQPAVSNSVTATNSVGTTIGLFYSFNLTSLVQNWVNGTFSNHGVRLQAQNELDTKTRTFASINHANSSLHPQLVITYTLPPTAPSSLTATAVLSSQIDLTWQDNSTDETGFKVERKIGAGGTYSEIATVSANTESYNSTGLTASTQYYYRVRAFGAAGNSAYSNEANATTLPNPPAAPSSLTATAVSTSQINLAWQDNATNETGFAIERKIGAGGTYSQIASPGANVTSFSNTGLAASTNYFYRVRAFNAGGSSAYSNESDATTFNPAPTLTSISPTSGDRLNTFDVVFTGTNFINGVSSVNFGAGITVNSTFAFNNATQIIAQITVDSTAALGARNVSVTNIGPGGGTSANQTFTVNNPVPILTSIVPAGGNRLETLDVEFRGGKFVSGSSVNVGSGITVNSITLSPGVLKANLTITASADTGARNFSVTNSAPGGGTSVNRTFIVSNPQPHLTSLAPASGNRSQTLNVVFTGTNFINGATSVSFPGTDIMVNMAVVNSATQITANITIASNAALGARAVSVTNPSPGGGTETLTGLFTVNNPVPTLTNISPNSGNSLQTLDVVFTGTNFVTGTTVNVGSGISINSTTINSSTTLRANLIITAAASSGTRNFSVTNSAPGGGTSGNQTFTVTLNLPNAPSGLTATTVSSSQINLTWQDNSTDEVGFKIERKLGAGGSYSQIDSVTANVTSYGSTGLFANTNYFYRVRAYNTSGNSAYSNEANATTLPLPPAAPVDLVANTVSSSQINLGWKSNGGSFKIERKTGIGGSYSQIDTVSAAVTSYSNTGLAANTTYFYRVRAYNAGGNSGYSNEANATTLPLPPSPPVNLTAGAVSSSQIELKWVTNGGNIKIERKTGSGGTYSQIDTVAAADSATTMIYNDSGLAASTNYFYRVRAYNAGGNSTYSNEANATTLDSILPPPSNLVATAVSSSQINLAWQDNSTNEIRFKIERKTGAGGTYAQIDSVPANVTSYSNTGLAASTTYFYRVRAFDTASANSAYSNESDATTFNPVPTLTSIAPNIGNRLQTLDVVFTGTNFIASVTSVNAGSGITVNSTNVTSSTSLTANLTIAAGAATGARNFSVTNSAPGGGTSGNQTFTVNNPAPTLASLFPANGNRLQTLNVAFNGTNFIDGVSTINFGADITVDSTTVNSDTQISAIITIGATAALGPRNVSVTNIGPGGGTSANQTFTIGNNPAPTLTGIAPNLGNRLQTLDVVFTGTNFIEGVTSVNAGSGISINSMTFNSATSLTANLTITAGAATGARNFSVTNSPPGGGTSANQTFTVNNPAPTLASIAPNNGNRLQTLDVVLTGTNFITGVSSVNFGADIAMNLVTVNSATQITANVTIGATAALGPRSVSVTNIGPGGGTSANQTFTVGNNPAPTLTGIAPNLGNRLQTLDVVFTGTNFIEGVTSVNAGSGISINSMTFNSATSLTANLTITAGAATGARNFSVTNSAPDGGTSGNQTFTVNNPAPTLASLFPANGNRLQTLNVAFNGTNFIDGVSTINFGADITVDSTTVNSDTQISAIITIGATAALGPRNVSVTNIGPGGGTSANQTFTVGNNPAPTLTGIAPNLGNRLQTLDVVFTGTNFIEGVTSVNASSGISVNSMTFNSSTSLAANLTITAGAATGARNFSVTNSPPGGGTSGNQTFTVNNPLPQLTNVSPANGDRLQTLDVVFTGTNFIDGVTSINFGSGITVNAMSVNSSTSLTANLTITAAAATGIRSFAATNSAPGGGTSPNLVFFTVNNPAPTLASIAPNNGNRLQTLDVVLTGTNFITGVSSVNFGADIAMNLVTVNSATQITANITIGATAALGPRNVSVTNIGPGGGTSANQTFTVGNNPAPTLTGIAPNLGNRLQTLDVVFTGTNFIEGVTSVNAGSGISINSMTFNGSTSLTANLTITAGAATGARNFSVTNSPPGGGTSGNQTFTVNNPAPTLASIAPNNGNRLQTLDVVLTGTNFITGVSSVNFGADIAMNLVTVNSATQITANITIGATAALGPRNISVTNIGPGGGTSANQTFTVGNNPAPTLTGIAPNLGNRLQTLDVVFTGTNFIEGVTSVNAGSGISVNSMTFNGSTSLTANLTITAGAATGARNFSVTNNPPGGGTSANQTFTVNNPAPTLTSIAPNNGNRLQTLEVVFTGTNFIDGVTSVNVASGITINAVTVTSSTSLTANLTIAADATTGARNFSVTNSVPGGGTSANQIFTVNNPPPTLASLSPTNGNRLQTLNVVFTGTNFIDGVTSVNVGTGIIVNAMTVNSATSLTANITITAAAGTGARNFTVTNSPPGGGTFPNLTFFTVNNPAPTLTSLAPSSGNRLQTLDVVFTGTNFIDGATSISAGTGITVNSTVVNSSTSLKANITITAAAATGAWNFAVSNLGPGGGISESQTFTVNNPAAGLTGISPDTGGRLQTLEVVLTGTNFINNVSSVSFGADITVNSAIVNSITQMTANITIDSNAALGPRNVSVSNAPPGGGTATLPNGFTVGGNPAPTLASIAPLSGNRLQTLDVVFTGTNFITGVTTVNAGTGITVNSMTVNSLTSLTANITITAAAASGARNFSVTNSAPGGGTSANQTFTVENPAPTLTGIAPNSGNRLQTLDVVLAGTNFISGVTAVNAGAGVTVNSMTITNSTSLTANVTITAAAAVGARSFAVTNDGPGGGTSANQSFTVNNPAPALISVSPPNGNRLQTLDVVLAGTNFIDGVSVVDFGADITLNAMAVNPASAGAQITANITIGANAALGSRNVSVTNAPPGGGTAMLPNGFTIGSNPAPTLTSLSPPNGNRLQTLDVVLAGTNFIDGVSTIDLGADITVNSMAVNSATQITANLTIGANAALGGRNVSVTNAPPGGGTAILPNGFTIGSNPAPTLSGIVPDNGRRLQTVDVVFTGTNFITGVTTVNVGSGITVNAVNVTNSTSLAANLTITAAAATGARNFSVTNSGPGGGTSANQTFMIDNPAPTMASLTPANASRLQTLEVILTGTNFIDGVSSVNFGADIAVNSAIVNSPAQITANITIGSNADLGPREVAITNALPGGGTTTLPNGFTVGSNPAPILTGMAPNIGSRLQTLDVVFTGTNFITGVTTVNVGSGITLNAINVSNSTSLTANLTITAAAATGARSFAVVNNGPGGGVSANQTFTVNNPAPALISVSPTNGNRLQTLEVILTGANFINGVSTVDFGAGITLSSILVNSATQIIANLTISSNAALGSRDVTITNAPPGGGTATLPNGFTVGNNPAPVLAGISPISGNRLQTLDVIFTGTNFISGITTVNVDSGIMVNSMTVNNSTSLTVNLTITAEAATGARSFSVTNSAPGGGTSASQSFTVNNPAPTLTGISPNSSSRLQTLDVVLTGTNFINGASSMSFTGAGITVNSIIVNSATQIIANLTISASAPSGPRNVMVTNAPPGGGMATLANGFIVGGNPAPTLSSILPNRGNRLQTLDVVFTGTNFINDSVTVNVGAGITVNSTTVNSLTSLTANLTITASAATGPRNFSVTNTGGGTSVNQIFTVNNPSPVLTSVSPNIGSRSQTLDVIFSGANFISNVTSVNAGNGITVNSTTVNSATNLTANLTITAAAALGGRSFSVTNIGPGGGTSGTQTFTVSNLLPTLLSPTNLVAEAMSMNQINLNWTDNSNNETGFRIVRRVGTIAPEVRLFTVGPNVQSYWDTELNRGTPASYQVAAFNADGDSPPSNFANETTATGVRCDVTRDFRVDASDVDFEIKLILQNSARRVTRLDSITADTNLDGKINIIDAVDTVNESLKSLLAATAAAPENNGAEAKGELRLSAVDITIGTTVKVPLTISVDEPVAALQLKIRGDSRALALGDPVVATENRGMTLTAARGPDQLAVLIYSLSGDCLTPGTHELMQFPVQAQSADFSKAGLQIESALLIGKSGTPVPVRIANEAANLKIKLPDKFALSQNYPNPFNINAAKPKTEIVYTIPSAVAVKLAVYNILGHEVALLVNSWQTPGVKKVAWDGRDQQGKRVSAGVYFYRLEAGDFVARQKMVLR